MCKILTRPKINFEFKKDKNRFYSLKSPLTYQYEKQIKRVNVKGEDDLFIFNLASVPYYLRWIYKPTNKQTFYPSIIHDYDYTFKKISRLKADLKLFRLQRSEQKFYLKEIENIRTRFVTGVKYFFSRWTLFILLRCFGWTHYK